MSNELPRDQQPGGSDSEVESPRADSPDAVVGPAAEGAARPRSGTRSLFGRRRSPRRNAAGDEAENAGTEPGVTTDSAQRGSTSLGVGDDAPAPADVAEAGASASDEAQPRASRQGADANARRRAPKGRVSRKAADVQTPAGKPEQAAPEQAGQGRAAPDQVGQEQAGQDQAGPDQAGQQQAGQDQAGQAPAGQDQAAQPPTAGLDPAAQDRAGEPAAPAKRREPRGRGVPASRSAAMELPPDAVFAEDELGERVGAERPRAESDEGNPRGPRGRRGNRDQRGRGERGPRPDSARGPSDDQGTERGERAERGERGERGQGRRSGEGRPARGPAVDADPLPLSAAETAVGLDAVEGRRKQQPGRLELLADELSLIHI